MNYFVVYVTRLLFTFRVLNILYLHVTSCLFLFLRIFPDDNLWSTKNLAV
jgi:hypothetical protein